MKGIILVVIFATCALAEPNVTDEDLMRRLLGLLDKRRVETRYTPAEQQQIVNAHNKYRRGVVPAASDMPDLKWNKDLAALAQEWANTCNDYHGFPANHEAVFPGKIGQNLFQGAASGVVATDDWYDEVNFYDRCSQNCMPGKDCLHYTQLVWAKTTLVGCGYAACPNMKGPKPIVFCNYAPAGNFIISGNYDVPPYKMSNPGECSNCKPHFCGKNGRPLKYTPSCQCKCKKLYTGDACDKFNCAGAKDDPQCEYTSDVEPGKPQCDPSTEFTMTTGGPTIPELCPVKCGFCKIKTTPRPPGACKDDKTCKEFTGMSPSAPMCDPNQHYTTEDGKHKLVDLCPIRCGLCKGANSRRQLLKKLLADLIENN